MRDDKPLSAEWLWPAGFAATVGALMSTRLGGDSFAPWNSMNLGDATGDDPGAVARNRRRFAETSGATPVFLRQLHGVRVARITHADAEPVARQLEADASVTTECGVACTVLVADCLPVLLCAPEGRAVGAAHAGWRGLAGGVAEAALRAVCEAAACEPADVQCWLGACIGPRQFEVGADVLKAFGVDPRDADPQRFAARDLPAGSERKWLANLAQLARDRLQGAGVRQLSGGDLCTVEDSSRFFSFRRDGVTGRMAAAIWIRH